MRFKIEMILKNEEGEILDTEEIEDIDDEDEAREAFEDLKEELTVI